HADISPAAIVFAMADGAAAGGNAKRARLRDFRIVIYGIDSSQRVGVLLRAPPVLLLLPWRTGAATSFARVPHDVLLDAFAGRRARRNLCGACGAARFLRYL